MELLAMESLTVLWVAVITGGVVSLMMTGAVWWQMRGLATRTELHQEVGSLERKVEGEFKEVDERFENERTIAREAHEKIYNRINACAKGVTSIEARMKGLEDMVQRLVDHHFKS